MDIPPSYASVIGNSSESAGVPIETQNIDLNRARLIVRQQEDLIELVMAITSIESTLNILHDEIRKRDSAAQEGANIDYVCDNCYNFRLGFIFVAIGYMALIVSSIITFISSFFI